MGEARSRVSRLKTAKLSIWLGDEKQNCPGTVIVVVSVANSPKFRLCLLGGLLQRT